MGSNEEDLATLWSRMCGTGKVDQGADAALQLDSALLQLHSQLSCGSQSGQPEGGNNVISNNLSSVSSITDLNPPRRTTSLPALGPTNCFGNSQLSNPSALQALQLSQYYSRIGASPPHAGSVSHQSMASAGIPPLAPQPPSKPSPLSPHLSALHSAGSGQTPQNQQAQQAQVQQAQQALANSLKRNQLGITGANPEDEQTANSYLQLARLLRHHSAPSSVLGAAWHNSGNGNQALLGNQDGFLNAMFSEHLTTMSGITSDSDGTQTDSGTIANSFDHLGRSQLLQEDSARSGLLRRADSLMQDQYSISEVMQLGNLELAPSQPRMLVRQEGSLGSASEFHLGPYPREDENRKRGGFDLLAEREQLMRKRCKSPDQDFESPRRRMEEGSDHDPHSHHQLMSQNHVTHHNEHELLPENSVLCKARAKRGCATHPRSIAERVRRTRISENMKKLQELVPNIDKQANTADMLEEAVEYMKYLKHQVQILSEARSQNEDEKMSAVNTRQITSDVAEPVENAAA